MILLYDSHKIVVFMPVGYLCFYYLFIIIIIIILELAGISHIIIDEAHERDINVDLMLLLMKELLEKNNKIRVVIMSATINAEFFQRYFNNCPLLCVPGVMFNVNTYFIDVSTIVYMS